MDKSGGENIDIIDKMMEKSWGEYVKKYFCR